METKKAISAMQAMQSKLKWRLQREERDVQHSVAKNQEQDIRQWRWEQKEELKEVEENRNRQSKQEFLADNRDTIGFKRVTRASAKAEELGRIQEELGTKQDNAAWAEYFVAQQAEEKHKLLDDRVDEVAAVRAVKSKIKEAEKKEESFDRQFEKKTAYMQMKTSLERQRE